MYLRLYSTNKYERANFTFTRCLCPSHSCVLFLKISPSLNFTMASVACPGMLSTCYNHAVIVASLLPRCTSLCLVMHRCDHALV